MDWTRIIPWPAKKPVPTGPDGFSVLADDPLAPQQSLLTKFLIDASQNNPFGHAVLVLKDLDGGTEILNSSPQETAALLCCTLERMSWVLWNGTTSRWTYFHVLRWLSGQLLRRKPLWEEAVLRRSLATLKGLRGHAPLKQIVSNLEAHVGKHGLSNALRTVLEDFIGQCEADHELSMTTVQSSLTADQRKALVRFQQLLEGRQLLTEDAWADAVLADLEKQAPDQKTAWEGLFHLAQHADKSTPSAKWLREARQLIDKIGDMNFAHYMGEWCPQMRKLASAGGPGECISDHNSDILRGLVWCTSQVNDDHLTRAIGDLGEICFKKVAGVGARSMKIGNACIFALSEIPSMEAAAQLGRLKTKVRYSQALSIIEEALDAAAQRSGQSKNQLEELAIPTFGLEPGGMLRRNVGDYTAELRITGSIRTELAWIGKDGERQAAVPAGVKREQAAELKQLKKAAKEIESFLPAQCARIEALLLESREWPYTDWRARYLDHPLLSFLARRLIWEFELGGQKRLGIWRDGRLVDAQSQPLPEPPENPKVRLWHSITSDPQTVLAWRTWLENNEIMQPFKQAHREIYILTDAERQTRTYSNRFAAHVIKQHQFAALCRERGWQYHLMGEFDSHNTPGRSLPGHGIRVEFWVESPYGTQAALASGIYPYVSTDQVRFYKMTEDGPQPLDQVPPRVFSEMMRDVDLFVGVCSVGNDPEWLDRGGQRAYWQSYSFGELSETAKTRQELLSRLLPRLKIAPQCSLDGKFLVVRGQLRTYKIHLGSSNVLMTPNDQYLCIVPRQRAVAEGKVFLPFEGDNTLSVILSKAFWLAADRKIKDESVLRQIRGA